MKTSSKNQLIQWTKMLGLVALLSVLSGCHLLGVRHANSHSHGHYSSHTERGYDSHQSRGRSHSRDYINSVRH